MNLGFREGYDYFQSNSGAALGAFSGDAFGSDRVKYVGSVDDEISALEKAINDFAGDHTPAKQLKGDMAEFWHALTFNIDAATNRSAHRAMVDRSNDFGSVDISTSFGKDFGLKYYATGEESAKHQAMSVFFRFKQYQYVGGKDSLEKFLADRNYTSDAVLNDPVYSGQIRVIPKDQMIEAVDWLKRMIYTESARRPEQVKRYEETLSLLTDRIADSEGNESIPLSKADAEKLALLAKQGQFHAEDFGITAPDLLTMDMLVKESLKAGFSAAMISLVLKVGPEIFKAIDYLVKNGEVEEHQFKKIGFAAVSGSAEGFVRGSVAAAITTCCKTGLLGDALKEVNPGVVGTIVAVTMNTMKNAYQVVIGKKTRIELSADLVRDLLVSSSALIGGYTGQVILHNLPVIGYLLGSFVGSVVGSFTYTVGYKTAISFCTETGITLFGLVEQDYSLPEDIISELGLQTFDCATITPETFEPETLTFDTFEIETIQPDSLDIKYLRRGVIGVSKIGYVE